MRLAVFLLLVSSMPLACTSARTVADASVPVSDTPSNGAPSMAALPVVDAASAVPAVGTPGQPEPGAAPADRTPAALYAACRARVEGADAPGECVTDADCARAGCSSELCVAAKEVGTVKSTCEMLPCFAALGSCGCTQGTCAWSLVDALPGPSPMRLALPPKP